MKYRFATVLAAALLLALPALGNGGTTCGTATVINPLTLPFSDAAGNNCGGSNTVTSVVGGCIPTSQSTNGPEVIYSITVASSTPVTFTVTPTTSTYDPLIYLLTTCTGSATDGNSCVVGTDAGAANQPEVLATTLNAGTYYVFIDSFFAIGNGAECGNFTLGVAAGLPVELTNFSVN